MPSVAVLCEYPTLLGGERSWLAAATAIERAGFEPVVVAPPAGALACALRSAGMAQAAWTVRDSLGRRRDLAELREELRRLLVRHEPSLVHANSLSMTRIAGPVARDLGIPLLGHLRDIVRLSARGVGDVSCADRLLAVSEATRRFHVLQGICADRAFVLYNGVDLEEFHPTHRVAALDIAQELHLAPPFLLVVAIGQIGLRKGSDVFVELARCILERRRDVHFLIVGERTSSKEEAVRLEASLREKATVPPCRGHVHFLGWRDDVPSILAQADLVVHAARQEPLGRVLLESAAAGKAVLATCVGGTREIFPPDANAAVLVPPCDVGDVAASELLVAALGLLENPLQREMLGRAARRRIAEQFDVRDAGAGLVNHYRGLVATLS
jgi:glycosyltransferase involved in cell wall biosynthesis